MRRILMALAFVGSFLGHVALADGPKYGPVKSMSEEEFQQELAHSKHYEFELASPDGLVDPDGTHIKAENLMAYLKPLDRSDS
jgi:hypothetical protein